MVDQNAKAQRTMRLTFPADDADLAAWLDAQSSPSLSMRMLAKGAMAEYGMKDYPIALVERGRTPVVSDPSMLCIDIAAEDPLAMVEMLDQDLGAGKCQSYLRGDLAITAMDDRVRIIASSDALACGDVMLAIGFGANHGR